MNIYNTHEQNYLSDLVYRRLVATYSEKRMFVSQMIHRCQLVVVREQLRCRPNLHSCIGNKFENNALTVASHRYFLLVILYKVRELVSDDRG